MPFHNPRAATAALSTLIVLQIIMFSTLLAGVAPHPPAATPAFGIGPFIGMSISAAIAALVMNATGSPVGRLLCMLAALLALVSFGPQKYFDSQIGLIWPAVVSGQIAVATLLFQVWTARRGREAQPVGDAA